jgi:hypothetical protein
VGICTAYTPTLSHFLSAFLAALLAGLVGYHGGFATDHPTRSHLYSAFWRVVADFAAEAGADMHKIYTHLEPIFCQFFSATFLAGLVGYCGRIATDHQTHSHLYSAFWRVVADFSADRHGGRWRYAQHIHPPCPIFSPLFWLV